MKLACGAAGREKQLHARNEGARLLAARSHVSGTAQRGGVNEVEIEIS